MQEPLALLLEIMVADIGTTLSFGKVLHPMQEDNPEGKLADAINEAFGSFDAFKEKFNTCRHDTFWKWLGMA